MFTSRGIDTGTYRPGEHSHALPRRLLAVWITAIVALSGLVTGPQESRAAGTLFSGPAAWTGPAEATTSSAVADVDGDGDLDLVRGNYAAGATLYLNRDGVLDPTPVWTGLARRTTSVALADVNDDRLPDLVTGILNGGSMLFLGTGSGFSPVPVWEGPVDATFSVALADINGDGARDLVCGNYATGSTLFLNVGGLFGSVAVWRGPPDPTEDIALGDIDDDGRIDLACGNYEAGATLFINSGTSFGPTPAWTGPSEPTVSIALGDVNGDGLLDLVRGNFGFRGAAPPTLYLNGGGSFSSAPDWTGPAQPTQEVVLGDVDGDGDLDLVLGNHGANSTTHLNFDGTFDDAPAWQGEGQHTLSVTLGDLDGDGDLDLVQSGYLQAATLQHNPGETRRLLAGTPSWSSGSTEATVSVVLGDVDGDGDLDLVRGNRGRGATLHLNTAGSFSDQPSWTPSQAQDTRSVALGDVDHDGDLDLFCGNYGEGVALFLNTGARFADTTSWTSPVGGIPRVGSITLGDVDGDGDPDLAVGTESGPRLFLNTQGAFALSSWSGTSDNILSLALRDIDGDGDLDLVCGTTLGPAFYRNAGGTLDRNTAWKGQRGFVTSLAFGDVDGDGTMDLVCGVHPAPATLYLNTGSTFPTLPVSIGSSESTFGVALADCNGDGALDLVRGNFGQPATVYLSRAGTFADTAAWRGPLEKTKCVAFGDVDGDGRPDVVRGNDGAPATLYLGSTPWRLDSGALRRALPNNPAHLRFVNLRPIGLNRHGIRFSALDAESDPVVVRGEYQLEGATTWSPMNLGAVVDSMMASSPTGVEHSLDWDVSLLPFSTGDVVTRLTVSSPPQRVGVLQAIPRQTFTAGHIVPSRPFFATVPDTLHFDPLTVGDSVQSLIALSNTGTVDLIVDRIESSDPRVIPQFTSPIVVGPGSVDNLGVVFAPRGGTSQVGHVRVYTNDPFRPTVDFATQPGAVRALQLSTQLLTTEDSLAMGQPAQLLAIPFPQVRFERVFLIIRPRGAVEFRDTIECRRLGNTFLAAIPGKLITEGGIEYFVRGENSGLSTVDPPGAPDAVYSVSVTGPATILSITLLEAPGGDFPTGRATPVTVRLPIGAQFQSGSLHFRETGAAVFDSVSLQVGGSGGGTIELEAEIPAAVVGARGVQYWVGVRTLTNPLMTEPPLESDPMHRPRLLRTTVSNQVEPVSHAGGRYRMVTVPLELLNLKTASSLEDLVGGQPEFGPYDPIRWRSFRWQPSDSSYLELTPENTATGKLRPELGRAFWLVTRDSSRISTGNILGRSTADSIVIPLEPGWNQVGSPYNFAVAWSDSTVIARNSSGVVTLEPPAAYNHVTRRYDLPDVSVLRPFEGYWLRNKTNEQVNLSILPVEVAEPVIPLPPDAIQVSDDEPGTHAVAAPPSPLAWELQVVANCGKQPAGRVRVGVSTLARIGDDLFDRSAPPMAPDQPLSLYLVRRESSDRLMADLRTPIAEGVEPEARGQQWFFDVARTSAELQPTEAVLAFSGLDRVPADIELCLIDRTLDRAVDVRRDATYRYLTGGRGFVPNADQARFALIAGSTAYADAVRASLTAPRISRLLSPFPNPAVGTSLIRYEVARPGKVTLEVYDFAGRRVRTLMNETRAAGRYELVWSGADDGGRRLSPGIYLLRLKGPDRGDTKKMVLVQ